jgi:formylglycine-generating enzyme required for sulfatase activity
MHRKSLHGSITLKGLKVIASLLLLSGKLLAADPVVSNVQGQQRPGTKLVDITYDVTADTPTVGVTLRISSDGGATFSVPATTLTGAVGANVPVGTGKVITWNARTDWLGNYSTAMRFEIKVDDGVEKSPEGFSLIPSGAFTMGRTSGDTDSDAPPVTVNVSAFYMGKYEVTKAEWDEVRTWGLSNGYTDLRTGGGKASNHPVQTISWFDMVKWCNARSEKEGLTPVYTVSGAVMKRGTTAPVANWSANGYRLPTEAEWEKAARGGVSGKRFPWGTDTISHSQANYYASTSYAYDLSGTVNSYHPKHAGSSPYTSPVGSFVANSYGLYDMAGNVWEWCWDWYGESTYVSGATDPRGPASGANRVYRGGGWNGSASSCRVAARDIGYPPYAVSNIGFRIVRSSVP